MKKIIFHHPLPLNPKAQSASGIRPLKILEAFKALGYKVDLVTGYASERRKAINNIKSNIRNGEAYDFCYSESSTMPTALTEIHHIPTAPFLDFNFFSFLKKNDIPIGLFYRDIYWLFDEYYKNISFIKGKVSQVFYKYDLRQYDKYLTKLYLPSLKMGEYIPFDNRHIFDELPPGFTEKKINEKKLNNTDPLELLYIGGLSAHYQMHKILSVLEEFNGKVNFTLCTRKAEWDKLKHEYMIDNNRPVGLSVVHKSGTELAKLYQKADIAMLFVKPQEYREFAAPVKLYEYLGEEKPIIATQGTLAGRFVEESQIGWSIPYDEVALKNLLTNLLDTPSNIQMIKKNIVDIMGHHTWTARAKKVINDLTKKEDII